MKAELPEGTLMWFGGYKLWKVSGEDISVDHGTVVMLPWGNMVLYNGKKVEVCSRSLIKKIKMLGVSPEDNDIFWQHPDFREGVIHDNDERT